MQKDERSETEPSSSDEQETTKDMHHTKNGKINSANGVIYDDHLLLAANNNTKSRPNGKVGWIGHLPELLQGGLVVLPHLTKQCYYTVICLTFITAALHC